MTFRFTTFFEMMDISFSYQIIIDEKISVMRTPQKVGADFDV